MSEKVELEVSQYRRERGRLKGVVKIVANGQLCFADTLALDGAKDRKAFAKQVLTMLKDQGIGESISAEELERRLLSLLQQVEDELRATPRGAEVTAEGPEDNQARPLSRNGYCRLLLATGGYVLTRLKIIEGIETPVQISSFDAWVAEETLVDEEAGPPYLEYRVAGTDEFGKALPELTIPAEQFDRLEWATIHWGLKATVFAQQRDHVAVAIRRLSRMDVPRRAVHAHTGFKIVNGQRVFLHAGGAIGADGPVPGIEVMLPDKLARYSLPATLADPVPAIRFLIGLLDMAPKAMMLVILALLVAAPLDSALGAITSLIVLGNTGMRKSTLIALLLHIYGGPFTAQSPVTTWVDTANALEKLGHQAKDFPLWVDDVRPPVTRSERDQQQQALQRMLRGTITRSGRGRLSASLKPAPIYSPRGPIITSAEQLPELASTLSRTLIVRMQPVNLERLTKAQAQAAEILPQVGAAWVQFLAGELDKLAPLLKSEAERFRGELIRKFPALHGGISDSAGRLAAAGNAFLAFAGACGALTEGEVGKLKKELAQALEMTALDTAQYAQQARPAQAFMEALRALLDTKRVVIEGITQATVLPTPAHSAELLGWLPPSKSGDGEQQEDADPGKGGDGEQQEDGEPKYERPPGAVTIGWLDHTEDVIYLAATVAFHEVHAYTRDQRGGVPYNREAVYAELDSQRLLARKAETQHTIPKKIGGQTKRVLALHSWALLGELDNPGGGEPAETGSTDETSP